MTATVASNIKIANLSRDIRSKRLGWAMFVGLGLTGCPTGADLDSDYEDYEPTPTTVTATSNTVSSSTTSGDPPCSDADVNDRAMSYWCGTAACHGDIDENNAAAPLWLFSPTRTQDFLDLPAVTEECTAELIVNTTNPENSLLITALKHTSPCGLEMPDGIDITPAELTCIEQWVNSLVP